MNWIPARRLCKESKQLLLSSHVLWSFYSLGHGQGQFYFGLYHLSFCPVSLSSLSAHHTALVLQTPA